MHRVGARKNVEEATGPVGGDENSLLSKVAPDQQLAGKKENAEKSRYSPQSLETRKIVGTQLFARKFQGHAASKQNYGIQPKQSRNVHGNPARIGFQDQERTGQGHKKNQHRNDGQGHAREITVHG